MAAGHLMAEHVQHGGLNVQASQQGQQQPGQPVSGLAQPGQAGKEMHDVQTGQPGHTKMAAAEQSKKALQNMLALQAASQLSGQPDETPNTKKKESAEGPPETSTTMGCGPLGSQGDSIEAAAEETTEPAVAQDSALNRMGQTQPSNLPKESHQDEKAPQ